MKGKWNLAAVVERHGTFREELFSDRSVRKMWHSETGEADVEIKIVCVYMLGLIYIVLFRVMRQRQ